MRFSFFQPSEGGRIVDLRSSKSPTVSLDLARKKGFMFISPLACLCDFTPSAQGNHFVTQILPSYLVIRQIALRMFHEPKMKWLLEINLDWGEPPRSNPFCCLCFGRSRKFLSIQEVSCFSRLCGGHRIICVLQQLSGLQN